MMKLIRDKWIKIYEFELQETDVSQSYDMCFQRNVDRKR